jgi:hypothetical protein
MSGFCVAAWQRKSEPLNVIGCYYLQKRSRLLVVLEGLFPLDNVRFYAGNARGALQLRL